MIIARWTIEARFGHKAVAVDLMKRWLADIGPQIGWTPENTEMMTGSVGARESTIVSEVRLRDLGELSAAFEKLATIESHRHWSLDLEPYVVSGTPRWEVYRLLD